MDSNGGASEEQVPLRSLAVHNEPRLRANSGDDVLSSPNNGTPVRPAISCTSLNDSKASKPRPQFLRTATRLSIRRGRSNSRAYKYSLAVHEPEIQAVNSPISGQDAIEECNEAEGDDVGELEQVTQLGREKTESFFTRYKLERGSLSAFKREAGNIIERDLPLILHRDNIIKVFADKSKTKLVKTWCSHEIFLENFKYWFQHPYLRLIVCYFVILCNFLVFAEDPVSHSKREADIPVVGNVFSFVFTKYPPDWRWRFLKVTMWLLAVGVGMVFGKTIIHGILLSRFLRLKMFRADQGSWFVQFLTVIISLYFFSHAYNVLLVLTFQPSEEFIIDSRLGVSNSSIMKAAACGTWLGDLITAFIVTDMMLQDNLYPNWAPSARKFWKNHGKVRIGVFWIGSATFTAFVISVIATDWITWDRINRNFIASTELSRAYLCSTVLVLDLLIVMQDWDFPHFTNTLDVNLPGFHKHIINIDTVEIQISGKWFNYGIIFLVMIFDLNMWKNQIFYYPEKYGQYIATEHKVYTVTNESILMTNDHELWTFHARSMFNPETSLPFMEEDMYMNSRFLGYSMWIKSTAFIPCVCGFIVFITISATYGRIKGPKSTADNKTIEV